MPTNPSVPTTTQFRALTTPSGKKAIEAWSAITSLGWGKDIAICAPTLEILKEEWKRITQQELIVESAQHVYIVSADNEMKNAPDVAPAAAKVSCQFCGRAASFIIRKIAVCERKECKEKVS